MRILTFALTMVVALFSSFALSENTMVVQSCIDDINYNEQGLATCFNRAAKSAREQVYNMSNQGAHYQKLIKTQCTELEAVLNKQVMSPREQHLIEMLTWQDKVTVGKEVLNEHKQARIAACYANGWSRARDKVLNENPELR